MLHFKGKKTPILLNYGIHELMNIIFIFLKNLSCTSNVSYFITATMEITCGHGKIFKKLYTVL